jgi:hypothetical protein
VSTWQPRFKMGFGLCGRGSQWTEWCGAVSRRLGPWWTKLTYPLFFLVHGTLGALSAPSRHGVCSCRQRARALVHYSGLGWLLKGSTSSRVHQDARRPVPIEQGTRKLGTSHTWWHSVRSFASEADKNGAPPGFSFLLLPCASCLSTTRCSPSPSYP